MKLGRSSTGDRWHLLRSSGGSFCGVLADAEVVDSSVMIGVDGYETCLNCDNRMREEGRAGRRAEPKIKRPVPPRGTAYRPRNRVRW